MINKIFKRVSMVQIAVNTSASIAMLVDNIFIGKFIGVNAIAAYGAVAPLLLIIMAVSQVLSTGGQIKCSDNLGRGEASEANRVASLAITIAFIFAILMMGLCFFACNPICDILGAKEGSELYYDTRAYLWGFMIGAPAFIGMLVLVPFVQLNGGKKSVLYALIVMTFLDLIGDFFAACVFKAGMFGIGLASSISYFGALLVLIADFLKKDGVLSLSLKNLCWKQTGGIISQGTPAALQKILRTLLSLLLNRLLLGIGGAIALGIFTLVNTIVNLCNSVGQGMGAGTLLLTGIYKGEEDKDGLKQIIKVFTKQSIIVNLLMTILAMVFAPWLIRLFTNSKEIDISIAAIALRFGVIDFMFYSLANCMKNFYQGIQNMKMTYVLTVVQAFLFSAISAVPLGLLFGINGVCLSYAMGDLLSCVLVVAIVTIKAKSFPLKQDQFMLLPDDFGVSCKDYYKKSVTSIDDVMDSTKEIYDFVSKYSSYENIETIANRISLCVEELGKNVIEYGFNDKDKNHLDICVIRKKDSFLLRMRDDCTKFDPTNYYKKVTETNLEKKDEFGIRIVLKIAKNVSYMGTLGLNNVLIEI